MTSDSAPHRRFNALTGDWILVSPHRMKRPWQGKKELAFRAPQPSYDPQCYLCPGNERAGGLHNPSYASTFVFNNDFAAILPNKIGLDETGNELLCAQTAYGTCRVICFSPRHDLSLAEMTPDAIRGVIEVWVQQVEELGGRYRWVQVFENKGEIMGCSNPHPHGQIWASDFVPNEATKEDCQQLLYRRKHHRPLLADYLGLEIQRGERVVVENAYWVALVPYWAIWPYEILLLPRRHVARLPQLTEAERESLANILNRLLVRYDNLFETSFPYSMGWHGASMGLDGDEHWQLHAHFYPPLLRSAAVKKFMVGYEMLAEPQRDLTPEAAAARLRTLPEIHYKLHAGEPTP